MWGFARLTPGRFGKTTLHACEVRLFEKDKLYRLGFLAATSRQLTVDAGSGTQWQGAKTSATTLPSNAWLHVAATCASGTVKLYLDGQPSDQFT